MVITFVSLCFPLAVVRLVVSTGAVCTAFGRTLILTQPQPVHRIEFSAIKMK